MAIPTHEIITQHPAHLFVGNSTVLSTQITSVVQHILCPEHGCTYCKACQGIYNRAHHQLLWLEPEGVYTREVVQSIFDTLSLQQDSGKSFFIIIMRAERLQQSTANALLKSLEEPPAGYFFLLATAYPELVIPTIRSRCLIHDVRQESTVNSEDPVVAHFSGTTYCNPVSFLALLDQRDFSDQESYELLETIIQHVRAQLRHALIGSSPNAEKLRLLINVYLQASLLPPQSGSSKLFWKNLYLKTESELFKYKFF